MGYGALQRSGDGVEELELWSTQVRLHRALEPLSDERGEGLRQTSFTCDEDTLAALLAHYDASTSAASFRSVGRSIDKRAFYLTLEKDDILLTVSCVAEEGRPLLLTFMADNAAQKRSGTLLPTGVIDAWTYCILPFDGSVPDAVEEIEGSRSYRFTVAKTCANAVAMYFRDIAKHANLREDDCVEDTGAISISFRGDGRTMVISAWSDTSARQEGAVYSVVVRKLDY
jgi:hypothetical protein